MLKKGCYAEDPRGTVAMSLAVQSLVRAKLIYYGGRGASMVVSHRGEMDLAVPVFRSRKVLLGTTWHASKWEV